MADEITTFRGEDKIINATIENDDGQALDLTTANTVKLLVYTEQGLTPNYAEGEKLFEVSGTNLTSNGTADFNIDSTDTSGEDTGLYVFQIRVVFSNSDYTAVTGEFFIKPDLA